MRVLILCQGSGERWDVNDEPYLGHPKHFIEIDGETLIQRTIRLLAQRGIRPTVVGPDVRYLFFGADHVKLDNPKPVKSDMSKLLGSAPLWDKNDRTLILYGDVYYTVDAINTILEHPGDDYHAFRRPGMSAITAHLWDETFALSFGPHEHERMLETATRLDGLVQAGRLRKAQLRHHLAAMVGQTQLNDIPRLARQSSQTHIDDWTDDFDSPGDYRRWIGRFYAHKTNLAVCIPWMGGDAARTASFKWTQKWWTSLGLNVYLGQDDTNGRWPNRSAARNDAARKAMADGVECLFFADADTFVPPDQLWAAAYLSMQRTQLVMAFTEYMRVTRGVTSSLMRHPLRENYERKIRAGARRSHNHASGAQAMPAEVFRGVGGYDQRFIRWGFEDRCIWLASMTLYGVAPRIDGPAYHWWHPRPADIDYEAESYKEGFALAQRVKIAAAYGPRAGIMPQITVGEADEQALRAILEEPGGPLEIGLTHG